MRGLYLFCEWRYSKYRGLYFTGEVLFGLRLVRESFDVYVSLHFFGVCLGVSWERNRRTSRW